MKAKGKSSGGRLESAGVLQNGYPGAGCGCVKLDQVDRAIRDHGDREYELRIAQINREFSSSIAGDGVVADDGVAGRSGTLHKIVHSAGDVSIAVGDKSTRPLVGTVATLQVEIIAGKPVYVIPLQTGGAEARGGCGLRRCAAARSFCLAGRAGQCETQCRHYGNKAGSFS